MKIVAVALLSLVAFTGHAQTASQQIASQQKQISSLVAQVAALQRQINLIACNPALKLGSFVTVDTNASSPKIIISGDNVFVQNGTGKTDSPNGLGNLCVGYSAVLNSLPRTGSHNLIIGDANGWASTASLIVGWGNYSGAPGTVTFGSANYIYSTGSSILGGVNNYSSYEGNYSSILGGNQNVAHGSISAIVGGLQNVTDAGGYQSVILGGTGNHATAANQTMP